MRPARLLCALATLVVAAACTSDDAPEVLSQAPVFDGPAAAATVEVSAPTPPASTALLTGATVLSEDEMISAALIHLTEVELALDTDDGNVLDPGINMDTIEVSGSQVTIEACTWRSKWVRQGKDIYHFEVAQDGTTTLLWTDRGVGCMNEAILASAGEFALEATSHFLGYIGEDFVDDPLLAEYWNDALVDGLRETRQRNIDGFRDIRFFADLEAGVPVAWAHRETAIELVIALRYGYDERYGTYDPRTDAHLVERTPPRTEEDLVGDDHVFAVVLWWENEAWSTFAIEDLYAIACDEPACVETLKSIGRHPNRAVHQIIDFPTIDYQPIVNA